ncbi:MAG: hypothetical protein LQ338_001449 [Usnochroma carphineum]|nr:MAG: hypothetical protein LQ338_001449 [Usnochroma carphineum]
MEVERELQQAQEKYAKNLKEMKDEMEQAHRDRDLEVADMLRREYDKMYQQLLEGQQDQLKLQANFEQLFAQSEERHTQSMQQLQQQLSNERSANEQRHRQQEEEFARERRRQEDIQRRQIEAFIAQQRDSEWKHQQQHAGFERERRRLEAVQTQQNEALAAERRRYEAAAQRPSRPASNRNSPLRSLSPSPERGPDDSDWAQNIDDDDEETKEALAYDPDSLELERERYYGSRSQLANGQPVLMALQGAARVEPNGKISGAMLLSPVE